MANFMQYKGQVLTAKTLTKGKITEFLRNDASQRDRLEMLIRACVLHAKENSNAFDMLNHLVNGLRANKSGKVKAVTAYIQEFVTGIKWQMLKNKEYGYKRVSKDTPVEYKEFTTTWYEYKANQANNQVAAYDYMAQAKRFLATIKTKMEEGKLKGDKENAKELVKTLETFTMEA